MCLAAAPRMRTAGWARWARIVAITSLGVRQPYPHLALSNTARAGATGFLRTLAGEIAADGVTVNTVQPGTTTPSGRASSTGMATRCATYSPPTRRAGLGAPDDLGAVVAFLCSAQTSFLTGGHPRRRRRLPGIALNVGTGPATTRSGGWLIRRFSGAYQAVGSHVRRGRNGRNSARATEPDVRSVRCAPARRAVR